MKIRNEEIHFLGLDGLENEEKKKKSLLEHTLKLDNN